MSLNPILVEISLFISRMKYKSCSINRCEIELFIIVIEFISAVVKRGPDLFACFNDVIVIRVKIRINNINISLLSGNDLIKNKFH